MTAVARTGHDALRAVPQGRRLPDFFILGAPKCGTTTLFAWLAAHPGTWLPAKEPNFLSPDVVDVRSVPGALVTWDAYLDRLCPPQADALLTGEATPRYLYSDLALEVLARFPRPPRLLILLRNPIDLVYSLHGQMLKQGDETEADFARAWEREIGNHPAARGSGTGAVDRRLAYPAFGLFADRVGTVLSTFPRDRVMLMILEETLAPDPAGSHAAVLRFLGLPTVDCPDLSARNRRAEVGSIRLQGRLSRLRRRAEPLLRALGVRKGRGTGIMRLLTRLNRPDGTPPEAMPDDLRARLAAFFAQDVSRLEGALGRKIEAWRDFSQRNASA
ncbi:MAG TPA: sulfotransferase domain-containing protein [Paracoccaceae bacterium]|nr:sulfotransferase domain-containing protein [Paracoccaceae bacterium]HMO71082.1 sulfotransferase domain-containing protein [Paracoccaceae bacterium]